jgi:hypothetical protein
MDQLCNRIRVLEAVSEARSQFGHDVAFWVGRTEVAHIEGGDVFEVRLTKAVIREMREVLGAHEAVELRRGPSDWLEVVVRTRAEADFALSLLVRAIEANGGPAR